MQIVAPSLRSYTDLAELQRLPCSHRSNDEKIQKSIIAAGLGLALALGTATSSMAITSRTEFSGNAPKLQQPRNFIEQNKTTNQNSQIYFSEIGSNYKMNAKAENRTNGSGKQYAERKGMNAGTTYTLVNETPRGGITRIIVTNNTWALVNVSIRGWFKTN